MQFKDTAFWYEVWGYWREAVTGPFSARFIIPAWIIGLLVIGGFSPDTNGAFACLALTGVLIVGAFFYAIYKTWESNQPKEAYGVLGVPDWTVRELFFYLAPSLRESQLDDTCARIGQEILNKLSVGMLKSWGSAVGNPTQVPIEANYWRHAEFTYLFFGANDGVWTTKIRDSHKHTNLPQYRRVWVNKTEALKIWPTPPSEAREAAILRLAQLRQDGVVLRNDVPFLLFNSALESWSEEVQEWMENVIEAIKPVSTVDSVMFTTLDTVPPARVPIPNVRLDGKEEREKFVKLFREHDLRLFRLEQLINKYRGIA